MQYLLRCSVFKVWGENINGRATCIWAALDTAEQQRQGVGFGAQYRIHDPVRCHAPPPVPAGEALAFRAVRLELWPQCGCHESRLHAAPVAEAGVDANSF